MRYHHTPVTTGITEKIQKINTAEDVQKREFSYSLGGNVNSEATMENSTKVPLKANQRVTIQSSNPTLRHTS